MTAALMIDMEAGLVHLTINTLIGSFIGALILQAAVRWVQKLKVAYWNAYMAILLPGIVNIFLVLTFFVALGAAGKSAIARSTPAIVIQILLLLLAQFLVQAGFVSSRIKIPLGRACLVTLVMDGIILVIAAILFTPFLLIHYCF